MNLDTKSLKSLRARMERARTAFGLVCIALAVLLVVPVHNANLSSAYKATKIDSLQIQQSLIQHSSLAAPVSLQISQN